MNNPYCVSYEDLRKMFHNSGRQRIETYLCEVEKQYTKPEIYEQIRCGRGPVVEAVLKLNQEYIHRSAVTETLVLLQLADFYFPHDTKDVCVELKRSLIPKSITTYDELIDSIESDTHVDGVIRSGDKERTIQLKRYRLRNNHTELLEWMKSKKVLGHYGNMNGTTLVVLMQSCDGSEKELSWDAFHPIFTKEVQPNITFDEVAFQYNDARKDCTVLHFVHPLHKRKLIPNDLMLARFKGGQ